MTKQEMLVSVEAKIRKYIPRLMELREGCIIELDGIQAKIVLSNYEFENGCTHLLRNKERLWYATDEDLKHSKIIGHEIMLNDVFQWLFIHKIQPHNVLIFWDLSKPLLKDQSEQLIKFLYNHIK